MIDIQITSNAVQVLDYIKNKAKKVQLDIQGGLLKIGILAQKESRMNAPRLQGYLERSIQFKVQTGQVMIYVASNSPAGQYAMPMHENEYKKGSKTMMKGARAGNRYIERAINDNMNNFKKLLEPKL